MAHLMWIEAEEKLHRETFGHFCEIAEARGHVISGLVVRPFTDIASWIAPADAYIVRTTGYIDQDELRGPFTEGIDAEKRVLWLGRDPERVNAWTVERFDLGLVGDQHFVLSRFDNDEWTGRSDVDRVVAKAARPVHGVDLLRGVDRVILSRPNVVRVLAAAEPLLEVPVRDLVDRHDLPVEATAVDQRGDACVASLWAPPGCVSPQAVLIGDGDWLVDGMLDRRQGDNVRFAENLIDWLGGAASYRELADRARELVNQIEMLIWEVALRHLQAAYGLGWPSVLSTERRGQIRRLRPDTPWERALDPGDKVAILKAEPSLAHLYAPGGISKTKAKSLWALFLGVRVRVAHVEHLSESPVMSDEVSRLAAFLDSLRDERRQWYASLDEDPAR